MSATLPIVAGAAFTATSWAVGLDTSAEVMESRHAIRLVSGTSYEDPLHVWMTRLCRRVSRGSSVGRGHSQCQPLATNVATRLEKVWNGGKLDHVV